MVFENNRVSNSIAEQTLSQIHQSLNLASEPLSTKRLHVIVSLK